MKRIALGIFMLVAVALPSQVKAHFGLGVGLINEEKFGGGLSFGVGLPLNLGIDIQIVGYADTGPTDFYWVQGNADLFYDFHEFWKLVTEAIDLHPYFKGGFTYAGNLVRTPLVSGTNASHGPGFNIGWGADWKISEFLTIGVDMTQAFIKLDGVRVTDPTTNFQVQLAPDKTAKVFNVMGMIKFFAY